MNPTSGDPVPVMEMPDLQTYSTPMEDRLKIMERIAAGFAILLILSAIVGCSQRGTSELLNDNASVQTAPDATFIWMLISIAILSSGCIGPCIALTSDAVCPL